MVWMTMLAALTGSSGLPANETRGRGGRGGGGGGGVNGCHNLLKLVGGRLAEFGCIWTLVSSLVKRDN